MNRLGVLTVDRSLTVRTWDAWIAATTGIASSEACGRPLTAIVPSVVTRGLLSRFEKVLETGEIQVLAPAFHHYLLPCPPREPSSRFEHMQQHVTLGPLRDGQLVIGVMATIEDVTARLESQRDLAGMLRQEDWTTRRATVAELAERADRETVMELVTALRAEHRDFNVLSSALMLLRACDVDVTSQLAALLDEPDVDLRIQAALALGEQRIPEAVGALIHALDDRDVNVRYHAIEALGQLRAVDAVDALSAIASGSDFFLVFPAVDALGRINDPRVAAGLVPLLSRADVSEAAADALAELGGAEVVRPLVDALNTGGVVIPIARALARLYARFETDYGGGALIVDGFQAAIRPPGAQRVLDAVSSAAADDLRPLVQLLAWLRGAAVERALARLLGTAAVRDDVIEAISRQDAGIVDTLIEQLAAEDPDIRLAAVVALGRLGNYRAAPAIAAMLSGDRNQIVAAAASLARIGDPASYEALLPLLGQDDAAVRQAAIGALNALGHPDMSGRVIAMLTAEDAHLRESAVRIAGYFGYPSATGALLACCDDAVESVRRAAIEHLPYVEGPAANARLVAALADPSARVRAAAAQALAHVPSSDALQPLMSATRDSDPWVRYFSARSLGSLGDRRAFDCLAVIVEQDGLTHVRIAALEAMGEIQTAEACDVLLAAAGSADVEIASAALRALGRFRDPRAIEAISSAARAADAAMRSAGVAALCSSALPEAIETLAWIAGADSDDAVSSEALEAIGVLARRSTDASASAISALLSISADPRLQERAVSALGVLPASRVSMVARGLAHANPDVRCATIRALTRMKHPDASEAIRSALQDDDATVREAAVLAVERLGSRGVGRTLAAIAQDDPSPAVRRAAASALGRVDERSW